MAPTEQSVRAAVQEDIDDLDLDGLTENLFLRASQLVKISRCKIVLYGVAALEPVLDVVQGWWIRHKPPQGTEWEMLTNSVHQDLAICMTAQIRADAMQIAKQTGGS